MIRTILTSIIFFFFFILLETAILSNIALLPTVPDLILILNVYLALQNGPMFGQNMGFVSGLIIDFMSAGPLGLQTLLRTIIGYSLGFFNRLINTSSFFFPALYIFLITVFKALLFIVFSFFFPQVSVLHYVFSLSFLFELLMNTLLAPFVFAFLKLFPYLILKPEFQRL